MENDIIHLEILLTPESEVSSRMIIKAMESHIRENNGFSPNTVFKNPHLIENVQSVSYCKENDSGEKPSPNITYIYHPYKLYDIDVADEMLDNGDAPDLPAASHLLLPSVSLKGLWHSLIFEPGIKSKLLKYVKTMILFADEKIDQDIISCNRVILLHGPPGTGKTSLCRALAQKACIHLSHRYQQGSLLEINSHSLFSKWFSESANLVRKMFAKIEELVSHPDNFVCVLIDEVESLTCARAPHDSSTEPSDAIRVVNALLTQIDKIKRYPNVMIMTTSNLTGKLDVAFLDRADVKQYIGNPCVPAIYEILRSCIQELMRASIITSRVQLPGFRCKIKGKAHFEQLRLISDKCSGLSGRALRKLPFITVASFINSQRSTLETFLDGLSKAVDENFKQLEALSNS